MICRDQILDRVRAAPLLAVAAVKAISLLQNPDTDLSEIARVVGHDAALCANTLKLANSALLGGRRTISSVDEALVRLGTRRMLDLVVSSSVGAYEAAPIRGYDLSPGALWRHSVAVACGTEELGKLLRLSVPPFAFTAGLLIDIGKHLLGSQLELDGQAIRTRAFDQHVPFEQAERDILGIDHAEVGAALLEHWQLPQALVAVVRWHHEPQQCPEQYRAVVDLVHAADQICTLSGIGTGNDGSNYRPCEQTMARLRLDNQLIEAALCRIVGRLDDLADIIAPADGRDETWH